MKQKILFNEETHEYFVNERKILSVTQIIEKAGLVETRWFTDYSRKRGTAVHRACLYYLEKDLDETTIHNEIFGYLEAFKTFLNVSKFKAMYDFCEKQFYNKEHQYCGTPDLLGIMNGKVCLIDIKTGTTQRANIQTSAYSNFEEIKEWSPKRFSLKLNKNKTFVLEEYKNDEEDFLIFLKCVEFVKKNNL